MAKNDPYKVAEGYVSHDGQTFLASEVAAMSEGDFIKQSMEAAGRMPKGTNAFFSDRGEEDQKAALKIAYQRAKDAAPKAEGKTPAQKSPTKEG